MIETVCVASYMPGPGDRVGGWAAILYVALTTSLGCQLGACQARALIVTFADSVIGGDSEPKYALAVVGSVPSVV